MFVFKKRALYKLCNIQNVSVMANTSEKDIKVCSSSYCKTVTLRPQVEHTIGSQAQLYIKFYANDLLIQLGSLDKLPVRH